jgi:hypothetical protein
MPPTPSSTSTRRTSTTPSSFRRSITPTFSTCRSTRCSRYGLAYDPKREVVVLVGGRLPDGQPIGDTWAWDGSSWTQITGTGPQARACHRMVFEPALGTLLSGGVAYGGDREMIAFHGSKWRLLAEVLAGESSGGSSGPSGGSDVSREDSNAGRGAAGVRARGGGQASTARNGAGSRGSRPAEGPFPRVYYGMVYEAARGSTLLFGGWDGSRPLNDTWELRCE